jgi:invasion protein IalB
VFSSQFSAAEQINGKTFTDWKGRCQIEETQEICFLVQGFSANNKEALMITTVDIKQHPKHPVVMFRLSAMLDATKEIQFKVDKNQPIGLQAKCTENECRVAFPLDKRMLTEFKRGNRGILGFVAKDTAKAFYFPVSLSGFTKGLAALKKN